VIIRRQGEQRLFITQPDHAHLSRQVMEHCVGLRAHPRRESILLAIGEHDNGWREADEAPPIDPDSGEPLDFVNAPPEVRQDVWPRGVARLAADPWAAALVANHAVTVYERFRAHSVWTEFFPRMEAMRDERMRKAGGRIEDLLADYRFVRLGDLISLMFCTGWTDDQRFDEWTVSRDGDVVRVTPDPFGGSSIELDISTRRLPARTYRDSTELREELRGAEVDELRGRLVP
jgi:hypothetical protein